MYFKSSICIMVFRLICPVEPVDPYDILITELQLLFNGDIQRDDFASDIVAVNTVKTIPF